MRGLPSVRGASGATVNFRLLRVVVVAATVAASLAGEARGNIVSKCRTALLTEGVRYCDAVTGAVEKCERKNLGRGVPVDCLTDPKVVVDDVRAEARARGQIANRCALLSTRALGFPNSYCPAATDIAHIEKCLWEDPRNGVPGSLRAECQAIAAMFGRSLPLPAPGSAGRALPQDPAEGGREILRLCGGGAQDMPASRSGFRVSDRLPRRYARPAARRQRGGEREKQGHRRMRRSQPAGSRVSERGLPDRDHAAGDTGLPLGGADPRPVHGRHARRRSPLAVPGVRLEGATARLRRRHRRGRRDL